MSTPFAIVFIIGKAAIWLLLPLALGLWEWRRHRRMMASGVETPANLPRWLQRSAPDDRTARAPRPRPRPAPRRLPATAAAPQSAPASREPSGPPATASVQRREAA